MKNSDTYLLNLSERETWSYNDAYIASFLTWIRSTPECMRFNEVPFSNGLLNRITCQMSFNLILFALNTVTKIASCCIACDTRTFYIESRL